ncbi:O-antigen ligase family protein [Sphingopyxis bauzanensis]|uniref:O-antigen ligase family protein n=1 Tax=Sphingopyxis bauzanensis TaxID=651663 RepID=UPI0013032D88|nr:O-antigen ligase family protein [Sphingopyxis bauzanensis]
MFIALTAVIILSGRINRRGLIALLWLLTVSLGLALTSIWSESTVYLQYKLPLVLGMPAILFAAGFFLAASGRTRLFANCICVLSFGILLGIWIFGIDVIVGFQTGLDEEFGGRYQSISRVLAVGAIVLTSMAVTHPNYYARIALFLVSVLLVFQVLYTGGRVGLLVIALAAPLLYFSTFRPRMRLFLMVLFGAFAFLVLTKVDLLSLVSAVWPGDVPLTIQRVLIDYSIQQADQFQLLDRENLWRLAMELWSENPVFGVGLASFPVDAGIGDMRGVYPHNIFLELAAETGLFGLALFLSFAFTVFMARAKGAIAPMDRMIATGVLASGVAISSVVSDFSLQRELFLGLGLYYGLKFPDALVRTRVRNRPAGPVPISRSNEIL